MEVRISDELLGVELGVGQGGEPGGVKDGDWDAGRVKANGPVGAEDGGDPGGV